MMNKPSDAGICFGVDVGGTSVKLGAFRAGGRLLEKWSIPTRTEDSGAHILEDICGQMEAYLLREGLSVHDVYGIGIGVPGAVTKDGLVLGCVNLGWGDRFIEKELSEMFYQVAVHAANDANIAALGEQAYGAGRGCEDMVMVTLGTGVGGGIILGGKILKGSNGGAGEIGHMPVVAHNQEHCSCGKTDCLELVASATGIVREAKKMIASGKYVTKLKETEELSAKTVLDLAQAGDEGAVYVANRVASILGTALADVASVVNPELFVIGGGVSKTGEWFLAPIRETYRKKAFTPLKNAKFTLAALGNDAGIYGAAALCETVL